MIFLLIFLTFMPVTMVLEISLLNDAPKREQFNFIAVVLFPDAMLFILLVPSVNDAIRMARVEELLDAGKVIEPFNDLVLFISINGG
ncbi:hypothetical protein PTE_03704 [Photorhabdus khanii NC19]|uniref:Uncharacterized protein n=1 Tax=Photorhabdus khanii NC19 TaxID=1004151 RepID=W3V5N6_9GAMM|nr:hypothetical protein PTE_03704 [Photorhabdus khanii NC19]